MFKLKTDNSLEGKEFFVTSAVALTCLILSFAFPGQNGFQGLTGGLFFFVIIPILYIKLVLKKKITDFGWNVQRKNEGLFWGISMLLITLLSFFILLRFTSFGENYSVPAYAVNSFWLFFIYEIIFVNFFVFFQEFFFRGFILFYLIPKISYGAIVLQFFLGVAGLFLAGSLNWQFIPALIISLTSGIIAYKSRSFIYSYVVAFLSFLILDSFLIYNLK